MNTIELRPNHGQSVLTNHEPLTQPKDTPNGQVFNMLAFQQIKPGDKIWTDKLGVYANFPNGTVKTATELPRGKYPDNSHIYQITLETF